MDYVFIDPEVEPKAKAWLKKNVDKILSTAQGEEDEEHETKPKVSSPDPS